MIAPVRELALLGGYGSGKSTAAEMRLKRHCALNGLDRRRKGTALKTPKAALIAPTFKILDGSARDTFEAVFPREWIRRRKGAPRPYVELVNGVVIELHSGPTLEGSNYFAILVEEIQRPEYDDRTWANMSARVRDPDGVTLTETYTGLPEEGRVRARFDRPPSPRTESHGGNWTILCATRENPTLKPEVLNAILSSVPATEAVKLIEGRWMQPSHALFPGYDSSAHIADHAVGNTEDFVHVGIDPGRLAAVVFGQVHGLRARLPSSFVLTGPPEYAYDDVGIRIVDQLLPDALGVEGICQAILAHRPAWPIVPGKSKIFHDPTISIDDRATIRRFFPGVTVQAAQQFNGAAMERAKNTNRALRDAQGTIRLSFSPVLRQTGAKRGVLEVMAGAKTSELTGELVDDNWLEHARDALGYLLEGVMPRPYQKAPQLPRSQRSWKKG